jgi:mRNA interferase MazF
MVKKGEAKRFDVYQVNLDFSLGHEIRKSRPCVIISPDEMNILQTVIIAPMTTKIRKFPFRVNINFNQKQGQVALDQIRTVDKARLIKKLGRITSPSARKILDTLLQIFSK